MTVLDLILYTKQGVSECNYLLMINSSEQCIV